MTENSKNTPAAQTALKRIAPDILAVVLFVLVSVAYFITPITQGLVLSGNDITGGVGAGRERMEYLERTGHDTRWTNALFSGMPTYQIAPSYDSRNVLSGLERVYELGLTDCAMYVFILLLGFYILMRTFRVRPPVAVFGAVAWAFSSYFFIIIGAGHLWKVLTLAFIPPTIAGMVMCYRGKYLWGGVMTMFFIAWQILSNHLQMTYYFLITMVLMSLGFLVAAIVDKKIVQFVKGVAVFAVAALVGVAVNSSNLYHTYQYSKQTMRGSSELAQKSTHGKKAGSGLSKEYITQWSYGTGETFSLLVPNVKGGASGGLSMNEKVQADPHYTEYMQTLQQLYPQLGGSTPGLSQYWGEQPGTSGPVYVGAFICMLFILSLFYCQNAVGRSLMLVTVLSVLLSWGHNFPAFTNWMIDCFPMYNKFRAVSSILVVAEFTIPLLAALTLARIFNEPKLLREKPVPLYISFGITAGLCALFALMPGTFFGDCLTNAEHSVLGELRKVLQPDVVNTYAANISAIRHGILSADAWRSFWIIVIGMAVLMVYRAGKLRGTVMVVLLTVLCLADMWSVNRRYLNNDMFVDPLQKQQVFAKTETDEQILQDKSLDYRVLNFASDTFNENETSYWHKSIGGYHAAKLSRYQDLISECIAPEMQALMKAIPQVGGDMTKINGDSLSPTINMLNGKYFILPLQQGKTIPLQNPYAMGNAWFVGKLTYVDGARAEMDMLKKTDRRKVAVADRSFAEQLGGEYENADADTTAKVTLTAYQPNELAYDVSSAKGGVVVLSEIYYPGWTATLDGKDIAIGRADYVLRAVRVPQGQHKLVLKFDPQSLHTTETLAYAALAVMLLALVAAAVLTLRKKKS
jgi:hypothetical protein